MTAEPSVDIRRAAAAGPLDRPAAELGRWSVGTLVGLLACTAALVGWRRLAGELKSPLPPLALLSVGGLLVAVAVGVRLSWHYLPAGYRSRQLDRLVALVPTVAVLALGTALSLPYTTVGGLVALVGFWALLVTGELWAWGLLIRGSSPRSRSAPPSARPVRLDPPQAPAGHLSPTEPPPPIPAEEVLQQLTRSQGADGSEQLAGWLRMPFAAGQRTASVHVSFCPQFPKTPELTVEQLKGPQVRIKRAVFTYGARLDLKLAQAAERSSAVLLQFSARSPSEG